jgi:hypothetical protein
MLRMLHVPADVKTAADLALPVPAIARRDDGQRSPQTITVQSSDALLEYVADLGDRAEQVRSRAVSPEQDNMLKISGDGRRAALDLRLAGLPQDTPGKTAAAAGRITAIWREHRDRGYQAPGGTPYPVRGALQLVFCDLGTPSDGWNVYDELRGQLTARGIPREQIRFIHDAKTDRDKAQLFAACRTGSVAVLVGSTEKMGVGTNVQDRAIALHHLDAPWRPADVAQREGRILRQGNLNPEVQIYRYVTEGSFDGYMWQTLERKARFISQVTGGRLDTREIADIGDTALSYSEVKALATGNPLLMDKAEADTALARLQRAERAHTRNQNTLTHTITQHEHEITRLTGLLGGIDTAIARRTGTRGDKFTMTVDGLPCTKRTDAGQRLKTLLQQHLAQFDGLRQASHQPGYLGGFPLTAGITRALGTTTITLGLDGAPHSSLRLSPAELAEADPTGLITRLENRLTRLDEHKTSTHEAIGQARREIDHARDNLGQPFPQAGELAAARDRAARIDEQLQQIAGQAQAPEAGPEAEPAREPHDPPSPDLGQKDQMASARQERPAADAEAGEARSVHHHVRDEQDQHTHRSARRDWAGRQADAAEAEMEAGG